MNRDKINTHICGFFHVNPSSVDINPSIWIGKVLPTQMVVAEANICERKKKQSSIRLDHAWEHKRRSGNYYCKRDLKSDLIINNLNTHLFTGVHGWQGATRRPGKIHAEDWDGTAPVCHVSRGRLAALSDGKQIFAVTTLECCRCKTFRHVRRHQSPEMKIECCQLYCAEVSSQMEKKWRRTRLDWIRLLRDS